MILSVRFAIVALLFLLAVPVGALTVAWRSPERTRVPAIELRARAEPGPAPSTRPRGPRPPAASRPARPTGVRPIPAGPPPARTPAHRPAPASAPPAEGGDDDDGEDDAEDGGDDDSDDAGDD
jgi:hypothetical protein